MPRIGRAIGVYGATAVLAAAVSVTCQSWGPRLLLRMTGGEAEAPDSIDRAVARYIATHPYELAAALKDADQRTAVLEAHRDEVFDAPREPILGHADGDVSLVAFLDYRCDSCRTFAHTLERLMVMNPRVRVVVRDLPILGEASEYAARVALAVHGHGQYLAFYRAMFFGKSDATGESDVDRAVESIGLDPSTIRAESRAPWIEETLRQNRRLAEMLRIDETPSCAIGVQLYTGGLPYVRLRELISGEMSRVPSRSSSTNRDRGVLGLGL